MAEVQDTDLFLVNRNDTASKIPAADLMAEILDDDYMIVNRSDVTYKVTGAEIKDSLGGPKGTVDKPSIIAPADNAGEMVAAESDEITAYDSGTKTLTLSGDKDLTVFKALDDVQQDSGYTPQTSAITGVTTGPPPPIAADTWSNYLYTSNSTYNPDSTEQTGWYTGTPANMFDGSSGTMCGGANSGGSWLYWRQSKSLPISTIRFYINLPPGSIRFNGEDTDYGFTGDGSGWYTVDNPPSVITAFALQSNAPSDAARCSIVEIDGSYVVDGGPITFSSQTTLTLTDDTDLANFRVGDVITQKPDSTANSGKVYANSSNSLPDTGTPPAALSKLVAYDADGWVGEALSWDTVLPTTGGRIAVYESDALIGPWLRKTSYNQGATINGGSDWSSKKYVAFEGVQLTPDPSPGDHCFNLTNIPAGVASYDVATGKIADITGTSITLSEVVGEFEANGTNYAIGPATTPATGTVASTDPAANTMTLSVSDESGTKRWIVNQGKFVKGEETPSQDAAPDADGLVIQSSAFASTPVGSLGHTSSDWQITLKDDIAYGSVIDSATDSTDLTTWQPTGLEGDTAYRCRVRHSSNAIKSEWSEDNTFKTASEEISVSQPGDVYKVKSDGILTPTTAPVKMINASVNGVRTLAVGLDGKVYSSLNNESTFTDMGVSDIVSVACDGDVQQSGIHTLVRCATLSKTFTATAYKTHQNGGAPVECPVEIRTIGCPGTYSTMVYALPRDGSHTIYFFIHRSAATFLGLTSHDAWGSVDIPSLPSDEKILRIATYGVSAGYCADAILILCESGNLYAYAPVALTHVAPGLATPGTATLILTNVKDIACSGGAYLTEQGVSAVTNDGTVYWSNSYRSIDWGIVTGLGTCKSPIFGGYTNSNITIALVLKDDGLLYGADRSTSTFTKLDYITNGVSTTPMNKLGSLIYGSVADGNSVVIIP